ncbi:MaoC/PaaZ C-terminal domain-containing protein [Actinotalea caeni]|uniref:MaoC/PaaZ C-terminal domain-containing protein n=1 Tax=Actinotalea caeni TaxID=1348467 RepID=UPI0012E0EC79|nr:MaoC/PaaZ C-terminal domain-containing protein [Actinotalea caeni]
MTAEMREVRLAEVPTLGSLYAQALGRMAQTVMTTRQPTTLPAVRYAVDDVAADRDQLAEYQHLLGEPGTDVLPAGYVHVLAFPVAVAVMARADFPLPLLGMVHLANDVEQRAPLRLGDRLAVRAWAEDLRLHRAGTQVDLVTEVDRDGETVWRGVSTYLAKGRTVAGAAAAEPGERDVPALPPVAGQWRLRPDVGRRYAAVSGDRNPIHTSALGAKLFGFPRAIAHGMYTAARALATVGVARGDAFRWTVEFGKPVLLPGTVTFGLGARATGGHDYAGWDARSGKRYLTGAVTPL